MRLGSTGCWCNRRVTYDARACCRRPCRSGCNQSWSTARSRFSWSCSQHRRYEAGAFFLSRNVERSTRNHKPTTVNTEPTVTASHTMAVARAPEMVSDPSTQASEPPTPEPAAAAENLLAALEDVHVALPEIPEPVFAGLDSGTAAMTAPRLENLVIELPEVPTLLVASH